MARAAQPRPHWSNTLFLGLFGVTSALVLLDIHLIFFYAPVERTMGIVQKIFYFHAPSAYSMYLGAGACFLGSVGYLLKPTDARDAFAQSKGVLPPDFPAYRHIGIYAYRVAFLRQYASLSQTPAERFEALEQLRALGHGHRIALAFWSDPVEPGVDTPEDLARVRSVLAGGN